MGRLAISCGCRGVRFPEGVRDSSLASPRDRTGRMDLQSGGRGHRTSPRGNLSASFLDGTARRVRKLKRLEVPLFSVLDRV